MTLRPTVRALALLTSIFPGLVQAADIPVEEQLAKAITIQTVSHQYPAKVDEPAFELFLDFLKSSYPLVFETLSLEMVGDYSLFFTWEGKDPTVDPVLFDAHYDVVPVEPNTEDDWKYPPFAGVIADGYVWGRGALDDKSTVITTLNALESLVEKGFSPERTLLFSFPHDEEIGGHQGAANIAKLIQSRGQRLAYVVGEGGWILDNSALLPGKEMAMISLAEKTYVTLTLESVGEGGHSSMPVDNNAVVNLSRAVTRIHESPFEPRLVSPVSDMLEVIGQHTDGLAGFLMRNQWIGKYLLPAELASSSLGNAMVRSTTAVTMLNGGIKENVIPQRASAKVNFRLLPAFEVDDLVDAIETIIDDPRISVRAEPWKYSPPVADKNGEGYHAISDAILDIDSEVVVSPGLLMATTDSPHYTPLTDNIYRFHPITVPAEDVSSIHGTNERVSVDSLHRGVALSMALITSAGRIL